MSGETTPITPEMISDDTLLRSSDVDKQWLAEDINAAWNDPAIRAALIADAVERGEASPACYTIRNQDGKLFYDVGQVRLRPGKPQVPAHEHWKGQTE